MPELLQSKVTAMAQHQNTDRHTTTSTTTTTTKLIDDGGKQSKGYFSPEPSCTAILHSYTKKGGHQNSSIPTYC